MCFQVVRWDCVWGRKKDGMKELLLLCSVLLINLIRVVYPNLKMITWPFLMHLKSDHLCSFRTEWRTFLQSSWKKWWSLQPGGADPVPREPAVRLKNALLGEVSTGMPKFPWSSAERSSLIEQALGRRAVRVLPRPKRVTCDSINFRGTEPRQQLLLIFNTKIQGNSEGEDTLLPQIEAGEWYNFQAVPAPSPVHYFFHLCLSCQMCCKSIFLTGEVVWGDRAATW